MVPPTTFLPPIKLIKSTPAPVLQESIAKLRALYNPPVRGSTRRRRTQEPSTFNSLDSANDAPSLRQDTFERAYTVKWVTALLVALSEDDDDDPHNVDESPSTTSNTQIRREDVLSDAASLLANISGTAGAGHVQRQFAFALNPTTIPHAELQEISVEIRDTPLDNHDYGSVGAQTWGGACILSEMIIEDPARFGLPTSPSDLSVSKFNLGQRQRKLRILELGAGTGLVSLAVYQYLHTLGKAAANVPHGPPSSPSSNDESTAIQVEIVATDYYPSVLENLRHNIQLNLSKSTPLPWLSLRVVPLDWSTFTLGEAGCHETFKEPFDIVFGADIVYEIEHARWIHRCLQTLLRQPSGGEFDPSGHAFHLVIPLRHTHTQESTTIDTVFAPFAAGDGGLEPKPLRLGSVSMEDMVCAAEVGSEEDVEYTYREIAWA